jgi:hypothetical protein
VPARARRCSSTPLRAVGSARTYVAAASGRTAEGLVLAARVLARNFWARSRGRRIVSVAVIPEWQDTRMERVKGRRPAGFWGGEEFGMMAAAGAEGRFCGPGFWGLGVAGARRPGHRRERRPCGGAIRMSSGKSRRCV